VCGEADRLLADGSRRLGRAVAARQSTRMRSTQCTAGTCQCACHDDVTARLDESAAMLPGDQCKPSTDHTGQRIMMI